MKRAKLNVCGVEIAAVARIRREAPDGFMIQMTLPMWPVIAVSIEDLHAFGWQTFEDFAFGLCDTGKRSKAFQMGSRKIIHQRRFRTGQIGGVSNFTQMISAHLNDREIVFGSQT